MTDDILDDLFHGCAFVAFVEVSCACRGWPDSDAVKRLAYRLYEEALAELNQAKEKSRLYGHTG
jgi:hypothetical protein